MLDIMSRTATPWNLSSMISTRALRLWDIFCKHTHLYFSMCFANPYGGRLFTLLACRLLLSVETEFINRTSHFSFNATKISF